MLRFSVPFTSHFVGTEGGGRGVWQDEERQCGGGDGGGDEEVDEQSWSSN